jgi:FMN phosphatase YigB (HAD superfamily)
MLKGAKLLIVDMDNTLCDTFHTLSTQQWRNVIAALRKKGKKEYADALHKNFGRFGFVTTLKKLKMPKKDVNFALRVYDHVDVGPLRLYPDAHALLEIEIPKVLVTRGERNLQIKKIEHLKIRKHFDGVYYIKPFEAKKDAFKAILKKYKVKPKEAVVIGDRIEEEIKDANDLKIPSVLVRRPNWPIHRGIAKPTITVKSLHSLAKKL